MYSAELYQALGHERQQELLREAAEYRLVAHLGPTGAVARLMSRLKSRRRTREQVWIRGPMTQKAAHG